MDSGPAPNGASRNDEWRELRRYIDVAANPRADIGKRLLGRTQQGQDGGFLRIGIRFHEGGGDLHLRVTRLRGENAADHAHHIHLRNTLRRRHATRRRLTNAGDWRAKGPPRARSSYAGLTRVSINLRQNALSKLMDGRVQARQSRDLTASGAASLPRTHTNRAR